MGRVPGGRARHRDNSPRSGLSSPGSRVLGWSHGDHGLRHSYARERMVELQGQGRHYREARELGHFRGDIDEVYLR